MKTNNQIGVCLIGAGRISEKHFQAIQANSYMGVKLTAVADIDPKKLNRFDVLGYKTFTDYECPRFCAGADLAVILTESGNHFQHAKIMLERGIDVLIEKPVTLRLDHAYELSKIADANNRNIFVVKQNRYNTPIQVANRFVSEGYLGNPQIGTIRVRWCRQQNYYDQADWRGTWHMDGGVISNQASHHIDLLRWFLGPVKSVNAISRRFGVNIETEDTIIALIEFQSGAVGTIEATTATRPRNLEGSFSMQGSLGAFEVGGFAVNEMRYLETSNSGWASLDSQSTALKDTSDVYGNGHKRVYEEIAKFKNGVEHNCVMLSEAVETLKLIHAIYRSVETGSRVDFASDNITSSKLGS